jgi:hypothetical protein
MTERDIEHMWKVVSNNPNHDTNWHDPVVVTFAALVAAAEREACAKVCDEMEEKAEEHGTECCKWPTPNDCAYAIRARGNT